MHLKHFGWSWLLLALCACPAEKPRGPCGGFTCTETERCESDTLTCVPDEPPSILAIGPSMVVSTPTFALAGIITDDDSVTQAEWQAGSNAAVPLTLDADGGFTIMVDAPMLDSQSTVITLRARDRLSQTTKDVSVQVDRVGPVLSLVRPDAGTLIGAAAVEVAVSATDGSGSLGALTIDGQAVSMPRSGVEAVQAITVPASHNGDALAFVVTAADPHGNSATQTFSLVGDRVGPAVTIAMPAANQVISTSGFVLELDITDPSPIASVSVQFGTNTYVATESTPGHWTANLLTTIEEQDQVITVDATDAAGNRTTQTRTVRVDRIAPTVTVASPTAGSLHRADLSVTVTTSTGTDSVSAVLEGQPVALTGGPTLWSGTVSIPQRDYSSATLTVTARDAAGNAASTDVMLNVDTVAPVVAFTAPAANQRFNASAFTASQNVTVSWTVTDADTQAATTTVNGAASTALTTSIATTANDNPAMYSTTVVAADRAGNSSTATVNWSVDRRVPTVVTWTPANNARNVEPWESVITFSEAVSGALPTSPALTITGEAAPTNDSWNTAHTTYTLPLATFKSRALDVAIAANLADDYGNPVAASTRRFHLATGFPSGTNLVIAQGVVQFDASSDNDGVVSIVALTPGFQVYQDVGGAFVNIRQTSPGNYFTVVAVSAGNVVNPTTLQSSSRVGTSTFETTAGASWWATYVDGVEAAAAFAAAPAAIVSRPPLANEPVGSNGTFGHIVGTTYTRGTLTRTLSNEGRYVVAQSNDSWAAFATSTTQVLWSHYRCRALITGGHNCGSIGYGASATNPTALKAAMTPNGNCLATTWTTGTSRQAVFQALSPCDLASCFDDTNLPLVPPALTPADLRVAPYGANGENTLLFSYRDGTLNFKLAKMTQTCAPGGSTELGSVPSGVAHQPIRVGNRPGLLYIDNGYNLRLYVP